MFTGIIESTGIITSILKQGANTIIWLKSSLAPHLHADQSISHNGVCLTVEEVFNDTYRVTAIEETMLKTNISDWMPGSKINLERCMPLNGRIDGHIVQGHVDTTAICTRKKDKNGSWEYTFELDKQFAALMIEKGSIALDGISLTIFNVSVSTFTVGIIPYTFENTNLCTLDKGDRVNIEFDMIGKYVIRFMQVKN